MKYQIKDTETSVPVALEMRCGRVYLVVGGHTVAWLTDDGVLDLNNGLEGNTLGLQTDGQGFIKVVR